MDARDRRHVVGVERNRRDGVGDGLVELHELLDPCGFEVERCDGAYGVDADAGRVAGQLHAVALAGAAHVGDDADASGRGRMPCLEHLFAFGDGQGGALARGAADEYAVGSVGDEALGIGAIRSRFRAPALSKG